jgi:two-component system, OmpR family, sensor histidine kinase SenX3
VTVALVSLVAVLVAVLVVGIGVWSNRAEQHRHAIARLQREVARSSQVSSTALDLTGRLERALDMIPQGVSIVDEAGETVFRNQAVEDLAAARQAYALVIAEVTEMIGAALEGQGDERTVDLFGPPRRTLVITTRPLLAGSSPGALVIIDDVSERRHLEAVRRDFVANISHELKTPVGALGLLAETLVAEEDPAVSQRLAGRIQMEAFRVDRTIEDLLELSRIESGEVTHKELVSVPVVIKEAIGRIGPAADQGDIEIQFEEPAIPLEVVGDGRQIVSAIYNLLDNAVKYSDPASSVEVLAAVDRDGVSISVRDHGIGIPVRDLERVFERFYRVDQARSRQTGGTGLGLAIVRHVANNHAGDVQVTSRLGEGSTFTLRLPTASTSQLDRDLDPAGEPTAVERDS